VIYNAIRLVGRKSYGRLLCVSADTKVEVSRKGRLSVGRGFRTRRNVELLVRGNATMEIGDGVFFNSGCILTAREKIAIGSGTIFGPGVMVFDNDHAIKDGKVCDNEFVTAPVTIGKNVWVGAGALILKGAVLEDDCVVAAGSVVKGHVKSGTIFVQKRQGSTIEMN
jgi:acetyltransferase-like isoleucine patch superfamily enzyme